ncbi:hypothetical protein [Sphingobacterium kitahiroshimense]|uniref:Uncharacterized protein n=1 Tax=Sphingobacterium kitahiroshimense TaxID=470446 RepID=A0ABV0BP18_9SPHI
MNTVKRYALVGIVTVTLFSFSAYGQLAYPPEVQKWDADALGNHRAIVRVNSQEKRGTGRFALA